MGWRALSMLLLGLLALGGCTRDPSAQAMESLSASTFSPKYHSGFWSAEAEQKSPLWTKAQTYCQAPDHADRPNCRVVVAVDVTIRVITIRPGEDMSERIRQWIRGGSKELGPEFPRHVPGTGFGELPKIPAPPQR